MTDRRGAGPAVVVCLIGAGVVLLAAGRTWATGRVVPPAPLPPQTHTVRGTDYLPELPAVGLLALAAVGGLLAARGAARAAIGAVVLLAGGFVLARCTSLALSGVPGRPAPSPVWPWVTAGGAAAILAAGAWVVLRGGQWAGLSARYDAPAEAAAASAGAGQPADAAAPSAVWAAMDRGQDPTVGDDTAAATLDG